MFEESGRKECYSVLLAEYSFVLAREKSIPSSGVWRRVDHVSVTHAKTPPIYGSVVLLTVVHVPKGDLDHARVCGEDVCTGCLC